MISKLPLRALTILTTLTAAACGGAEAEPGTPAADEGAPAEPATDEPAPDPAPEPVDEEAPDPADSPEPADDPGPPPLPAGLLAPSVAPDLDPSPDVVEIELVAAAQTVTLADGLELEMYTYNGTIPGPAIEVDAGDELVVRFRNDLPEPTTVHWHGLRIPNEMDGTPAVQDPVAPGGTFEYRFVVPEAGSYWYHPHVRSHVQVEKGLYGPLVVRDADDPTADRERVVMLDDLALDGDALREGWFESHPEVMHGRYGNMLLTNGLGDPEVGKARQGDVERWRLVNAANARTMYLKVQGASWTVIGTDGGLLEQPWDQDVVVLPSGGRYDLWVSFDQPGEAELISLIPVGRNRFDEVVVKSVEVEAVDGPEATPPELEWTGKREPRPRSVDRSVELVFDAEPGGEHGVRWLLNGQAHPTEPLFTFNEGDVVRMKLRNLAGPEHPFHLHGQFFTVVPNGQPWADLPGLRDTVLLPGMSEISILAFMDNPGRWMAHCHILEHAALGMMGEIVVDPAL